MSPLRFIQEMTLGRVLNEPLLATINVLEERKGLTDATLAQTLATSSVNVTRGGKAGAAIIVGLPYFDVTQPDAPGPALMVEQQFRCIEKPGVNHGPNGTGLDAESMAVTLLQLMHHFRLAALNLTFVGKRGDPLEYAGGEREIVIVIRGKLDLQAPAKTPAPVFVANGQGGYTINSAAGATVYFTSDGTYPTPGAGTTQAYDQPNALLAPESLAPLLGPSGAGLEAPPITVITVPDGTLVQAVAIAPNQQASDLAAVTVC